MSGLTFTDAFYGALLAAILGGFVALIVGLLTASAMKEQALISFKATSRMLWVNELRAATARYLGVVTILLLRNALRTETDNPAVDEFQQERAAEASELRNIIRMYLSLDKPIQKELDDSVDSMHELLLRPKELGTPAETAKRTHRVVAAAKIVFDEHWELAKTGE